MRTISQTGLASMHAVSTAEVWLVLLTLSASGMQTIRVVNNNENVISGGNTFLAFPFEISLPSEDSDSPPRAYLRIDNVDRQIVAAVRALTVTPEVRIDVIRASAPDAPEITFTGLFLRNVQYDAGYVSGELTYDSIFTEPVTFTMTPSRFPGLF